MRVNLNVRRCLQLRRKFQLKGSARIVLSFLLVLATVFALHAQGPSGAGDPTPGAGAQKQSGAQSSQGGGMANAGPRQAQFDSQHRPITAGGFVKSGPIIFQNVAAAAGLTHWHHTAGTPEKQLILEAKGPGVCLLDYDNDGWLDIYLVNGSTYDALAGKATPPHAALFHNNHDGTFTDVTQSGRRGQRPVGLRMRGWRLRQRRLARSLRDQLMARIVSIATITMAHSPMWLRRPGVTVGTWSTGATFGDYDGDGRLDLFVDGYAQIDLANPPLSGIKSCGLCAVPISRRRGDVRPARPAGRTRPSVS